MSYEYSSNSKRLDLPNPFRIENYFYLFAATILIVGAMALLMMSRAGVAAHLNAWSFAPLLLGVYLLLRGIFYTSNAVRQFRFFFGRGEPKNLAAEVPLDREGKTPDADALKETLRQNALKFQDPQGALNNLLYTWLPNLIYAPHPIQLAAQRQFQTGLATAITFVSFCVAWVGVSDSTTASWMGLFFFLFAAFLLIKPMNHGAASRADLGVKGLVGLVLAAILGPVIIPMFASSLPDLSDFSLNGQTLFLLLTALLAESLFFIALTKQMIAPPPTTMACEQLAISMNSHPKQLFDELDRELQKSWTEQVPNRRYARILPQVSQGAGAFSGEILEETQPMPREDIVRIDFASCFTSARYKWLGYLNVMGVLLNAMAVGCLITFAAVLNPADFQANTVVYATLGMAMLVVASFCFKACHILWGRFDFISELMWIEISGNYQSAKMDYGNQFTDRIKTEKQVINIESMTLRVWVAQLESVSFGKDSPRWLVGMSGVKEKAQFLSHHLTQFAQNQSIIVAPTAGVDMQKIAGLAGLAQVSTAPNDASRVIMQAMGTSTVSE